MSQSLLILCILTPAWLALVYFGTKKSAQATGLVAVPGLAIMGLAAVTPVPPEGVMLAPDQQVHFLLCKIAGGYMTLTSLLSAVSLLATHYSRQFKAIAQPKNESVSDERSPTPPNS